MPACMFVRTCEDLILKTFCLKSVRVATMFVSLSRYLPAKISVNVLSLITLLDVINLAV